MPEGVTLLRAITQAGVSTPTLCYDPAMRPVNVCRVCVVELKGARALVPACSRVVENGMDVLTDSPRVRQARRVVLELLQSSVDTSTAPDLQRFAEQYGAQADRFGDAERVNQPVRADDNDLYVRDYGKCILCYKCVAGLRRRSAVHFRARRRWTRLQRPHRHWFRRAIARVAVCLLWQLRRGVSDRRLDGADRVGPAAERRVASPRSRRTRTPSVRTAAWAADSASPRRTRGWSRSSRRAIIRSRAASCASKAASVTTSSIAARPPPEQIQRSLRSF